MPNTAAFALAQASASLPRSQLRWEMAYIAAAWALLWAAAAAVAPFFFRRRTRDLTLIYFGVFCAMYAVRLLANCQIFRSLFDESPRFWSYVIWVITCTILLPFLLFLYQISGERLRRLLRWLLAAEAIFAIFGIVAAAVEFREAKLNFANSVMVLGTVVAVTLFAVAGGRRQGLPAGPAGDIRVFVAGFVVWMLFVIYTNLADIGFFPRYDVEFLGFLQFVVCLGYISARRTFANEERLASVNKELEIARQIQSSTLPQSVPKLKGIEIAARYEPMSAVAGDFYDFLIMDEKRVGILIADVTGHGVPAAMIASMLKVALAGQAAQAEDPARVLSGLNRALCGKFEEHFVTAAYLFVDLEKRLLRYSGAGHPAMMLASRTGGKVKEIEENGLMLGLFPEAVYASVELAAALGDRCLLYTDGLVEAKNAEAEEFGKARCEKLLEAQRDMPPASLADALLGRVAEFSGRALGRAQEDDITVVVLGFGEDDEQGKRSGN